MGLFDFLFGSKKLPEVNDPEQLRDLLLDAAAAGEAKRLAGLCRAHQDLILQHFPDWKKVPEAVRADRAQTGRYVQGLIAVAQFFATGLRRPELLQLLIGPPESNPLVRWQEVLRQARSLMDDLRYKEAAGLLTDLLIDVRGLEGSGADTYLPITHGHLGECYFHGGEVEKAVAPTRTALDLCEQSGDAAGVVAYLGNLYEIHRYLGQGEAAAGFAERLAGALAAQGKADDAAWYRKQARLVRAGEPRNRVVAVVGGRRYELDEVPTFQEGRVQFQFERNRVSLRPATVWTERGEKLGGEAKFDEAAAAFREAIRADVFDPHPRYLQGLSLLHLQRASEAVESYQAVEELAPGWFHCRSDLWLAQQIVLGDLDHRAFLAVHALEDGHYPPAEKVKLAESALADFPDLAPLHLCHGKGLAALGRAQEAEAAYRKGLACAAEPDIRTRLLVELGSLSLVSGEERTRLLREAVELDGNLVAGAMATVFLKRELEAEGCPQS